MGYCNEGNEEQWIAMALEMSGAETFALLESGCAIGFASSQIRFGSFLYASMIAMMLMKRYASEKQESIYGSNKVFKLPVSIGDYSYGIFYVHMFALMVVQKLMSVLELSKVWVLNFSLCFIFTAVGSYLIVLIARAIAGRLKSQNN